MKKVLFFSLLLVSVAAWAQDAAPKSWKYAADFSGTGAFAGTSNYFAAGGVNTLTILGKANAFAHYKKGKISWDTDLAGQLGAIRQGKLVDTTNRPFAKNVDILNLSSKLGYGLRDNLNATVYGILNTQFMNGYDNPLSDSRKQISGLLAPGKVDIGVGLDWKPKLPLFESFSVMYAPLNMRMNIVRDFSDMNDSTLKAFRTSLGNINNETVKLELGSLFALAYRIMLLQKKEGDKVKDYPKMSYSSTLNAFMGYLQYKDKTTGKDAGKPFQPDITLWTHSIDFQINKIFRANAGINFIYDDDIRFPIVDKNGAPVLLTDGTQKTGPRTQFNYTFGVGMGLNWSKEK